MSSHQWQQRGVTMTELSAADRDALVLSCSDIALRLSRRFSTSGQPDPDLEQAATVGLVAAAARYDPSRGPFQATEELEQTLGASPMPHQIAERTGLSVNDVLTAWRAHAGRFTTIQAAEVPESREVELAIDTVIDVRAATIQLDEDARELLRLRFDEELTQRQMADRLGTSQPQIHRRLSRALEQMRRVLGTDEDS